MARPFHRWYPFVEGYSADLVERALIEQTADGTVLDPFGGSGTTALAAAMLGRDSVFAEVNPYMAWVADVKVNQSRRVAAEGLPTNFGHWRMSYREIYLPPTKTIRC